MTRWYDSRYTDEKAYGDVMEYANIFFNEMSLVKNKDPDYVIKLAFYLGLFRFQCPVFPEEAIDAFKIEEKDIWEQFINGQTKLKGYILGKILKKYKSIDPEEVMRLL